MGRVKPRRALALFLLAAGCFGLGLAVARWLGWRPGPSAPNPASSEPRIYIDAGEIILYDGSLRIDPPPPPNVEEQR
jgi:hypothetical protein